MKMINEITDSALARILATTARRAQIPKKISGSPTNWQRKYFFPYCSSDTSTQEIANEIESFLGNWFKKRPGPNLLVLAGGLTSTKTKILEGVTKFAREASFAAYEREYWRQPPDYWQFAWAELALGDERLVHNWLAELLEPTLLVLDGVAANLEMSIQVPNFLNMILDRREGKFTILTTDEDPCQWEAAFGEPATEALRANSCVVDFSVNPVSEGWNQRNNTTDKFALPANL